jgi:hypothetical protein
MFSPWAWENSIYIPVQPEKTGRKSNERVGAFAVLMGYRADESSLKE